MYVIVVTEEDGTIVPYGPWRSHELALKAKDHLLDPGSPDFHDPMFSSITDPLPLAAIPAKRHYGQQEDS